MNSWKLHPRFKGRLVGIAALALAIACSQLAANVAFGNQGADQPAPKKVDVVELLEDGVEFFIDNLDNGGKQDGSVAARQEQSFFSGKCSLSVSPFHRFRPAMPDWNYPIKEKPEPGEFRFLRFAWKRTEAPGILLQFFTRSNQWEGYYAGSLSKQVKRPMIRLGAEPPRQWELVTRDLFKDFGPISIVGINFSAMEGGGEAYFDHIYLGRTVEDLDRVTRLLTKVVEPDVARPDNPAPIPWAQVLAALAALLVLFITLLLLILIARRGGKARHAVARNAKASGAPVANFACHACGKKLKAKTAPGKMFKCPKCGADVAVPHSEASS